MIWTILLLLTWSSSIEPSYCSFAQSLQEPNLTLAFAAPQSFGRTHFIVGQPDFFDLSEAPISDHGAPTRAQSTSVRSLFSPDDDVKKELIHLIDHEQKKIQAAVFIVTEPEIARALSRAKKRGVLVELVTDVGCLKERANKISMLCDQGCRIYVYNPPAMNRGSSLMHHKFALFSSSKMVWTGSYNFTKAASKTNQENAVIISDKKIFEQFAFQFRRLKDRSYRYGKQARA